MSEGETRKQRRRFWKRLLLAAAAVAIGAAAAAVFAPGLLPESAVRRQVEAALAERLGRPVSINSAVFTWADGLQVRGLRVGQGGEAGDSPLAQAAHLAVRLGPLDLARAAAGGDLPLDSVRAEGLELWLVLLPGGRWNTDDLPPMNARAVQVAGGRIHVENRAGGGNITLTNVYASLGELAGSGQGYLNLTADLPGERPGRLLVTATLNSLDFSKREALAGSVKVEWSDAAWADLAAAVTADPSVRRAAGRTSGRLAASFGRGAWSAEGAVEAADLAPARAGDETFLALPQAVFGFQVRQAGAGKPLEVSLARFTAAGIDVRASGTIDFAQATGAEPGRGGNDSALPRAADLQASARISWAPLRQNVAALARVAERLEQLGGGADAQVRLTSRPEGLRLAASADLSHTVAVLPHSLRKEAGQALRVELEAACPPDLSRLEVSRLAVFSEAGPTDAATGRPLPLAVMKGQLGRRPAETWAEVAADADRTEALLALLPALGDMLGPLDVRGPLALRAACKPAEAAADSPPATVARPARPAVETAADSPPAWAVTVHADLSGLSLALPDGPCKRPQTRFTLDARAVAVPDALRVNLTEVKAALAAATFQWTGVAEFEWAKGSRTPTGRFQGTLALGSVEAAGAILAPGHFAGQPAPVAGDTALEVAGELTEGRVRGQVQAGLDSLAIAAGDYFVKPAGRPAAVSLAAFWQSARDHYVLAEADVTLPGARLHAVGRGTFVVEWLEPPGLPRRRPGEPGDGAPPGELSIRLTPESSVELRASVADMAQAAALSPALVRGLEGYRLQGAAEASLVFIHLRRAGHLAGTVDLTQAALDLGEALRKPRDMPLHLDLSLDVFPPQGDTVEFNLTRVEARLGDSVTSAAGRVKLARPGPESDLRIARQALGLIQEADLEVTADWRHTPAFRAALPCLEPLYARADLDGPTHVRLAYAGTPLRARLAADIDATTCRILHGDALLKPAGTAAALRLEARYGEAPGELALDRLEMKLADSQVSASGRLLFDNPSLHALAPPSAWSIGVGASAPDAAALASLFPARLGNLKPTGGMTLAIRVSGDAFGTELQTCDLSFRQTSIVWLDKKMLLDGPVSYDGQRLATDGLRIAVGRSDVTLVAYIQQPDRAPTGSVLMRGQALDLKEMQDLIRHTSEHVSAWAGAVAAQAPAGAGAARAGAGAAPATGKAAPASAAAPPPPLSEQLGRWGQRLLAEAQLSAELALDRVLLAVPEWNTTYELTGLSGEGRLAARQFTVPRFQCTLNEGTISGQMALDFRVQPPVAAVSYGARDLRMADNLKPFIDTTFPGMQAFGTLATRATMTQPLAGKAYAVGRGETVLVDGLLEGPAAPEYITAVLPGLKLTQYRFNRMSNDFENRENGDVDNRMIFEGKSYDIYIFGVTKADGRIEYQLGVDLAVSLGSKVLSRTLDVGKLPLLYYTGRIKGTQYAERDIRYVLPHEFAYEVFVRRNLLFQLARSLGEKPPHIQRPPVAPPRPSQPEPKG